MEPCESENMKNPGPPKWDKRLSEGYPLLLGTLFFGTAASLLTRSYGPLLIMGSVGLFSAVENCDEVFGKKD